VSEPAVFDGHQNTDPFVFDGPFIYCICQQPARPSLRKLAHGDIILFGSHLEGEFLLDTVFVVSSSEPYRPGAQVPASAPGSFRAATDWPLSGGIRTGGCAGAVAPCATSETLTFYQGATVDRRVRGMFSFAPAIITSDSVRSFRRRSLKPIGALANCISPGLSQGLKISDLSEAASSAAWTQVVQVVRDEHLALGIAFAT
jgi:hypothetical protein